MLASVNDASPTLNDAMAAEIRAQRAAMNWTQKQLAERSGVKYETVKNVLGGVHNINVVVVEGMANAFGMTAQELMHFAELRLARMSEAGEMMPAQIENRDQVRLAAEGLSDETGGDEPSAP